MISVGVREFKEHATEILRRVREEGETYQVTYHGRPVAHVIPAESPGDSDVDPAFWEGWRELAREISARWPEGVSAVDAIREGRREL